VEINSSPFAVTQCCWLAASSFSLSIFRPSGGAWGRRTHPSSRRVFFKVRITRWLKVSRFAFKCFVDFITRGRWQRGSSVTRKRRQPVIESKSFPRARPALRQFPSFFARFALKFAESTTRDEKREEKFFLASRSFCLGCVQVQS
jgi:hypothetical protein